MNPTNKRFLILIILTSFWYGCSIFGQENSSNQENETSNNMKKETVILQPSLLEMTRSVKPYLSSLKESVHKGKIKYVAVSKDISYLISLPPNHDSSSHKFASLDHLHGAGVGKQWLKHDIHWIASKHEKAVERDLCEPMVIISPTISHKIQYVV